MKWDITSDGILNGCEFDEDVTKLIIPDGVKEIGEGAFQGCQTLKSVRIPEGVISIGERAFHECAALCDIIIPETVTEIAYDAFENTAWMNNYPEGFVIVNHILLRYSGKYRDMPEEITVPEGVCVVNDGVFTYGQFYEDIQDYIPPLIKKLILPEGLKVIGDWAFSNCTFLEEVHLPKSIEYIGFYAFRGCRLLKRVPLLVYEGKIIYQFPEDEVYPDEVEEMIRGRDYEAEWASEGKYGFIFQIFTQDIDTEGAGRYIRKHFRKMMPIFFRLEDTALLKRMQEHLPDLIQEHIDELIQEAIWQKKYELQIMLTDYKYQHKLFRKKDWSLS